MDPIANIAEQRSLAEELASWSGDLDLDYMHKVERLAELVIALDQWQSKGGFSPYPSSPEARLTQAFENASWPSSKMAWAACHTVNDLLGTEKYTISGGFVNGYRLTPTED